MNASIYGMFGSIYYPAHDIQARLKRPESAASLTSFPTMEKPMGLSL
jgi:hypothetical protein